MADYFETRDYVAAHGQEPKGLGNWGFAFQRHPAPEDIFWCNQMYYSAAKREAARASGHRGGLWVLP